MTRCSNLYDDRVKISKYILNEKRKSTNKFQPNLHRQTKIKNLTNSPTRSNKTKNHTPTHTKQLKEMKNLSY